MGLGSLANETAATKLPPLETNSGQSDSCIVSCCLLGNAPGVRYPTGGRIGFERLQTTGGNYGPQWRRLKLASASVSRLRDGGPAIGYK